MRIGLDVRWINNSGIGVTLRGLLDHLSPEQLRQITLFGPAEWRNPYPCAFKAVEERVYGLKQHWSYAARLNSEPLTFFHMPHYDVPYFYRGPLVATVYDLIHYLFPQYSTKPLTKLYSGICLRRVAAVAKRIIAISEHTKKDMVRFFPESEAKIRVIYPAVDRSFAPVDPVSMETVLRGYGLERGYVLYVGNLRESKNTPRLARVYSEMLKENSRLPPLVLAGRNSLRPGVISLADRAIRLLGSVPFQHLPALYSGASLFVFPSLYEGFGIPPLEAMACGVPVVVSRAASLPESCGEAALYVDPASDAELARAITSALANSSLRVDLKEKGFKQAKRFSWNRWAQETWDVYEQTGRELEGAS